MFALGLYKIGVNVITLCCRLLLVGCFFSKQTTGDNFKSQIIFFALQDFLSIQIAY